MNQVILMGRLTRDPEVRYSGGESSMAIARYTLAVDRRFKRDGEATADFINCVSFGKTAEFAERYFRKGIKIAVSGRIQTGSYTNKDGVKVYTTEVVVENQEFCESKAASDEANRGYGSQGYDNGGYSNNNGYSNNSGSSAYSAPRQAAPAPAPEAPGDGFMNIPDGIDEELPFA